MYISCTIFGGRGMGLSCMHVKVCFCQINDTCSMFNSVIVVYFFYFILIKLFFFWFWITGGEKYKLCRASIVKLVLLKSRFPETRCPGETPCPEAQPRPTGAVDSVLPYWTTRSFVTDIHMYFWPWPYNFRSHAVFKRRLLVEKDWK